MIYLIKTISLLIVLCRLPKLETGLSVKDQLYIVSENDRAKMVQELAALDDDLAGPSKPKAFSVLTPSKSDAPNKSRSEKQKVILATLSYKDRRMLNESVYS
jgi:hypothetical protein